MRYALLGTTVEVCAPDGLLSTLTPLVPVSDLPATVTVRVDAQAEAYRVAGPDLTSEAQDEHDALEQVLARLNAAFLAGSPGFSAHCGVVSREGRCTALPGVSGAGKSTLVAALLRRGYDYVSDEALVVHWETGAVLAYPKPLTLLSWSLDRFRLGPPPQGRMERAVTPGELGSQVAREPLVLAHVVVPQRTGGPASLLPAPASRSAMTLLANSFNHYTRPQDAVRVVSQLAAAASAWTLEYGDPVEAADLLASLDQA